MDDGGTTAVRVRLNGKTRINVSAAPEKTRTHATRQTVRGHCALLRENRRRFGRAHGDTDGRRKLRDGVNGCREHTTTAGAKHYRPTTAAAAADTAARAQRPSAAPRAAAAASTA